MIEIDLILTLSLVTFGLVSVWMYQTKLEAEEGWVYAESCGLILAFLGSGGRNDAMIFNFRYSSSR